jgi:hypothetical protein
MKRWYRAWVGTVTDDKLIEAASLAGVSRLTALGSWHAILESAAALDQEGAFTTTARRIATIFAEPVETIEAVLEAFEAIGLTRAGHVVAWRKRQPVSDHSTERVRRHRERIRHAAAARQRDETGGNRFGNGHVTGDETGGNRFGNGHVTGDETGGNRFGNGFLADETGNARYIGLARNPETSNSDSDSERRGEEKEKAPLGAKKKEKSANDCVEPFPRPDGVDERVWRDFLVNRRRKKLANTPTAHKRLLDDLRRLSDDAWPPGRLVEHAAGKGWGAIYDPRESEHRHDRAEHRNDFRDPVLGDYFAHVDTAVGPH